MTQPREEFSNLLHALIRQRDRFDYLVIETTGLVDPAFAQEFFLSEACRQHLYLDGVVTVVDAKHVLQHLEPPKKDPNTRDDVEIINEAVEQIAFGDKILLNKVDLVSEEELQELERKIASINPSAVIHKTLYSKVDVDQVLNIKSFEIDRVLKRDPGWSAHNHDPLIDPGFFSTDPTGNMMVRCFYYHIDHKMPLVLFLLLGQVILQT